MAVGIACEKRVRSTHQMWRVLHISGPKTMNQLQSKTKYEIALINVIPPAKSAARNQSGNKILDCYSLVIMDMLENTEMTDL